jgi:hypothetical protein
MRGRAIDANEVSGTLPCNSVTWGGAVGSDLLPLNLCSADAEGIAAGTFDSNGHRTLTLTATDPQGGRDTATVSLTVVDPPADIKPDVTILHPEMAGLVLGTSTEELEMRFHVFDPDDDTVTYSWRVGWPCQLGVACDNYSTFISGSVSGASDTTGGSAPGATQSDVWDVFSTLPEPGCGLQYPAVIELGVSGSSVGHVIKHEVRVARPPC